MRAHPISVVIGALVLAVTMNSAVPAAEFGFPPDQATARLTATAKRLRVSMPFKHRSCSSDVKTACSFFAGSLAGIAVGPIDGRTEFVNLMFPLAEGDVADMLTSWDILIALVSPQISAIDRHALVHKFFSTIEPGFTSVSEQHGAVIYTLSSAEQAGLHFTAAATN